MSLLLPLRLFAGPLGPFRAPGLPGDGLHGAMLAGRVVLGWLTGDTPAQADVLVGPAPYWPVAPLPALLLALFPGDDGFGLGLVVATATWLAGVGPYALARRWGAGRWAAVAAALVAQASPAVLRAIPGTDLAALAVGPFALGLAFPRLAPLCGAWSLPSALWLAAAGLLRRSPPQLAAGVWLLGALVPPSPLMGSLRRTEQAGRTVPAWVGERGATLPLPPADAAPVIAAAERAGTGLWLDPALPTLTLGSVHPPGQARPWWGDLLVPLQRIHGGPVVALGLLAALARRRRGGAAGIVGIVATTMAFGWQLAPGEAEFDPLAVERLRGAWEAPGGSLSFAAPVVALGSAAGAAALGPLLLTLVPVGPLLENPRLVAPVVALPPDPLLPTLTALPAGAVAVFPASVAPYFQGVRPLAQQAWEAASAHRRLVAPAALVAALTPLAGIPVDASAADALWAARDADPLSDLDARYLLVDLGALPPMVRPRLDGWLAERAGQPVARAGERLLYDLDAGPLKR